MTPDEPRLGDEIDEALQGMNLQELDLPPLRGGRRGGGDAESNSKLQRGTVVGVDGSDVIVELGPRVQGVISTTEFEEPPKVGEQYDFTLVGREEDLWLLSRKEAQSLAALDELEVGSVVKAKVTGQNTGGLELRVHGLAGFMPASHVSTGHVEDLSTLIGDWLVCEVLELDGGRKRLLLSRRNVERREAEQARTEAVGKLAVGQVLRGKVTRVEAFGAFVDVGGVEGLVHVSNISRSRVDDARNALEKGADVQVKVLKIEEGGKRIGLGIKQLEPDPWDDAVERYRADSIVEAKVTRVADFGAFMELEPGLEGLLHVSQLGDGGGSGARRRKPSLEVGQVLSVRVQSVDPRERRISLSRLDSRGALIGSEEAAEAGEIDEVLRKSEGTALGTNLGSLFKKALGGGEG